MTFEQLNCYKWCFYLEGKNLTWPLRTPNTELAVDKSKSQLNHFYPTVKTCESSNYYSNIYISVITYIIRAGFFIIIYLHIYARFYFIMWTASCPMMLGFPRCIAPLNVLGVFVLCYYTCIGGISLLVIGAGR